MPSQYEDPSGPRSYHGTIVMGTKLYLIGGFNGTEYFNTCTQFDAVKKTWKEVAPMHCRRCYVSVSVLNGMIYALGGYDGHSRQVQVFNFAALTRNFNFNFFYRTQAKDIVQKQINGA